MSGVPGLRFAYLLGLVVWLGGLLVLGGVTAPVLFEVLQARVPADGRVLAGAAFGAALARFHLIGYACGAVMAASLVLMALIGPRPRPYAPRLAVIGGMLALTTAVTIPIGGRMRAIQAEVGGAIGDLPAADGRRAAFDRLHGLSNVLLALTVLGGLTLVFWEARDRHA
jgi:hypothetical protein